MPGPYLYPGVYVEETPSGVRPIAGVSTSDTAFVDFFARGAVDRAVRITSWGDFEREFGGLDLNSEASYAVQQYYLNGGRVAWIVRVAAPDARAAERVLSGSQVYPGMSGVGASGAGASGEILTVTASSPGRWGNNLQVAIDYRGVPLSAGSPDAFNLVVREITKAGGKQLVVASETFRNLTPDATSSRFVETVVNRDSRLVRVTYAGAGALPSPTGSDVIGDPARARWLFLGQGGYQQGNENDVRPADASWLPVTFIVGNPGTMPDTDPWRKGAGAAALLGQDAGGQEALNRGIYELERIAPNVFNLLCIPAVARLSETSAASVWAAAATLCEDRRAFLIVDVPETVTTLTQMADWANGDAKPQTNHAAVYFPRLQSPDPLRGNDLRSTAPSGTIAGVYARTDAERGVWKAPAGVEAGLRNASLPLQLTDLETGALNPIGVNVLRGFPIYGNVAWGARTLEGADQQASEWKYVPVRRTALYIEESLYQGLKWVVFEPNDEPLWSQIRLNVGSFMQGLFRQGAFAGSTPRAAYLVKCDSETTTPADVNLGIVNIIVGFAPLKPAEFVIIKLQQLAGQVGAS
ncbi:phage tail sheath family protein [Microbacterium ureisolvens]|uniref:phage tail sheath family protein n=1 Tax=Microbacterium ureisolvens TaxID=2781186 RepID=UPI00362F65EE